MKGMEEVEFGNESVIEDESEIDNGEVDGGELAMAEDDEEIVEDMSFLSFNGHSDSVYCAAIHPNISGAIITGGGDDRAFIWTYGGEIDEMSNNTIGAIKSAVELTGHKDTITSVGFNFDGTMCLTASYDGTIKIWKVSSDITSAPILLHSLEGPEDIEWAEWHSKGNAVVAGSSDGTCWMWLANTGQCVQVLAGHEGGVSSGGFTKDGKLIYTGGEDGTVRAWMPKTGACKHVFSGAHFGHEAIVTCFVNSEDGELLVSGSGDGTVKLFQLSTKKMLLSLTHSKPSPVTVFDKATASAAEHEAATEEDELLAVECVGLSRGALKFIASGGMDKSLKIWEMSSGSLRCQCLHPDALVALQWVAAHPVVCTAALDLQLRLWDARSGTLMQSFTGHTAMVTNIYLGSITAGQREEFNRADITDVIISCSDDKTSKIYLLNIPDLLK